MSNEKTASQSTLLNILHAVQSHIDTEYISANRALIDNAQSIDNVINMLSDAPSKKQYMQEIAYLSMRNYYPQKSDAFSPFSVAQFNKNGQIAAEWMAQGKIPTLKMRNEEERSSRDISVIEVFVTEGYRYNDIFKIEPNEVFLDCGAFLGDTAIWARRNGAKSIYAFEPCADLAKVLRVNLDENQCSDVTIVPFGVSDTNATQTYVFSELCAVSGKLYPNTTPEQAKELYKNVKGKELMHFEPVPCIKLDDWCQKEQVVPTYIKMDIEGGEFAALHGATEVIKQYKPKLAICLYHRLDDMWRLPLLIKSLVPEYRFYCKKNFVSGDFVLYAII